MNMAATPVVGAGYITAVKSIAAQINAGTAVPAATTTVNGAVKKAALVAVPATFADLAAVRTWAAALTASLIAAGEMSAT
jgi:hypothetical protein